MAEQCRFGSWGPTSEEILSKQFPLHRSCRDGDLEALSLLLVEAQHGIYEEDNFYGWTPAHWAAYFGKLNCLMRLLEAGLDVDVSSNRLNQTSMHIAAFAGRSRNVKWLLHCGAKIDRQLACLRKLMTTTRVGVNSNIRTSRFRQTPLHLAAFGGHPQCLLWLVSASADLNMQDYLGETAVHKAARTGSMECISLLVSHGARLCIRNNSGQTATQLSTSCGHDKVTLYLEQAQQCQPAEVGGVYDQAPSPRAVTSPSPHDVTSRQVHPCVISHGLNGGRLPPAGPQGDASLSADTGDSPMEEDVGPCPPTTAADGPVTDITTHLGVSANLVSIGGRKRCREDGDDLDHKRRRSDFSLGSNGAVNGAINGFHSGMPWSEDGSQALRHNGDVQAMRQSAQVVRDSWSGVSCENAPPPITSYPWQKQRYGRTENAIGPCVNLSLNHQPVAAQCRSPWMANGGYRLDSVVGNGMPTPFESLTTDPGHSPFSQGHQPTSSVCEHQDSMMVEQGYDSMLHDTMLTGLH